LAPAVFLPGASCDGTNVVIPLAALGMNAADFDPVSGDVKKLVMGITAAVLKLRPKTRGAGSPA